MRTLRTFLDDLKKTNDLRVIDDPVSWDLQAAAVCGMSQRAGGPAVQFTNVTGYPGISLVGSLLTGPGYCYETERERKMQAKIAIGLGVDREVYYDDLMEILGDRKRGPIKAIEVDSGPCQEVVKEGRDVNLLGFPIPRLHDKDGGRYLTSQVVMTRDAEVDWTNWGIYRLMVQDRNHLVMGTLPHPTKPRDVQMMVMKYAEKKQPLPFAIAIGVSPALLYGAASFSPPRVDEAAVAGGFMLDPIPMIKAKLSDIMLPADAEVILEGHIYPGEMADEGPFAWVSYYTPKVRNFVYKVELISQRKDPILPFVAEGMMPSDTVCLYSLLHSRDLMDMAGAMGCGVRYISLPVEARLVLAIASVAIKLPGVPQRISNTIFGVSPLVRRVLVVDSDCDPEDLMTPLNDMGQKAHPLRDWHLQSKIDKNLGWTENHDWDTGMTSTFWWDASWPYGKDPETLPMRSELEFLYPRELQDEVIRKWNDVLKLTPKAWRFKLYGEE